MPDAYEATISDVFPDRAPGSFTWVGTANGGRGAWVWTTFFGYQWDLNYANPNVFAAVLDTVLWLANRGIEIFRMDAVPFMWKRLGTSCMNQPEVHDLMQALHALVKLAAPATIFKAEAIVSPEDLVPYLGGHARYRPECELAYHNQLMVMLWSSLATKDARLAVQSLRRMATIPAETAWATYVRCHDDIGWAVSDTDAWAVGWSPFAHRRFLNDFYSGAYPMSHARGALFQDNPETGDARISGSCAALCGISEARERGDAAALDAGIRRHVLLHAVTFAWGGVPLLYMGDELALDNDTELPRRPGARAGQPVDAPAVVRRRRGRPPRRPRQRRGPGVRRGSSGSPRCGASCPRCTRRGSRSCWPSTTRTCSRGAAATRAAATSWAWSTSPSTRCRWTCARSRGWASWRPCCRPTATWWSTTAARSCRGWGSSGSRRRDGAVGRAGRRYEAAGALHRRSWPSRSPAVSCDALVRAGAGVGQRRDPADPSGEHPQQGELDAVRALPVVVGEHRLRGVEEQVRRRDPAHAQGRVRPGPAEVAGGQQHVQHAPDHARAPPARNGARAGAPGR